MSAQFQQFNVVIMRRGVQALRDPRNGKADPW